MTRVLTVPSPGGFRSAVLSPLCSGKQWHRLHRMLLQLLLEFTPAIILYCAPRSWHLALLACRSLRTVVPLWPLTITTRRSCCRAEPHQAGVPSPACSAEASQLPGNLGRSLSDRRLESEASPAFCLTPSPSSSVPLLSTPKMPSMGCELHF